MNCDFFYSILSLVSNRSGVMRKLVYPSCPLGLINLPGFLALRYIFRQLLEQYRSLGSSSRYGEPRNQGFQFALPAVHCTSSLVSYIVRNVLSVDCVLPKNAYALPIGCESRLVFGQQCYISILA
ncbi:hypothetical protein M441DRAFT_317649 [Trichoderma asperellum CBS 433.97]|uniref:Uncharacterized protein n=1 Tax=Trichoderma asperellum (strain ATCC 204424 / CBS 433.97 / NBRC 101777) TaxID=1042311 RepID=A0A2T3ZKX4_TRIA4|nr:hypothetical protein M441DRAFT_317649 [Trichoderma asperellum CBS 433.97]PTB45449.1 hypothetical protein M441DRAFT_317649 [Trichoderma asperellum CBS 433.97]